MLACDRVIACSPRPNVHHTALPSLWHRYRCKIVRYINARALCCFWMRCAATRRAVVQAMVRQLPIATLRWMVYKETSVCRRRVRLPLFYCDEPSSVVHAERADSAWSDTRRRRALPCAANVTIYYDAC